MKTYILWAILLSISCVSKSADTLSICSPSGKICVKVWLQGDMRYAVYEHGKFNLQPSESYMLLDKGRSFSGYNRIKTSAKRSVSEGIILPVPENRRNIKDYYYLLTIAFS